MDIFGNVALVEIPIRISAEQRAWLEMMVSKGKIAVPPGGTLPEGSVISIFMRTMLWNSEEQGQSLAMVPEEVLHQMLEGEKDLTEIKIQVAEDQKRWLDRVTATSKVPAPPGDSNVSMFVRLLLESAIEQQKALERSDPWADDDEM